MKTKVMVELELEKAKSSLKNAITTKTKRGKKRKREKERAKNSIETNKLMPWFCFVCRIRIKKRSKQIRHLWFSHVHPGN